MYIVSGLKKVPQSLQDLMEEEEIYIFINDSGFMTCKLFREYAKLFVKWVQNQRLIGYFTPNERIILLLDGHPSRKDWKAARILAEENIVAVTFPGGLTPILQPIDVCINRPFHQAYAELYRQKSKQKRNELNKPTLKAAQKRLIIIQYSNEAFQKVATTTIRKSSFECTGTCPRNINRMLSNSFIVNDDKSPRYPNGRYSPYSPQSAKVLTANLEENEWQTVSDEGDDDTDSGKQCTTDRSDSYEDQGFSDDSFIDVRSHSNMNEAANIQIEICDPTKEGINLCEELSLNAKNKKTAKGLIQNRKIMKKKIISKEEEKFDEDNDENPFDFRTISIDGATFQIIENTAKGDCYFKSISYGLYGHESEHETLRANACQYIVDNAEQFSTAFISAEEYQALALKKKKRKRTQEEREQETMDVYINRMTRIGEWAEGAVLGATALMTNRKIVTHIISEQQVILNEKARITIHLLYTNNNHYETLVLIK
ncbi:MAG: hypothetical protein EZS28_029619 [Streblomastix strix]|uniref:OTU domain-containing protein n=1 Tax=Streblomastix strix TaxID=222440 RepID=A0A5J4UYK7_9EUKA|nr:MAG: hypothetical protein EZS28_029619 [Streblomastix strix]